MSDIGKTMRDANAHAKAKRYDMNDEIERDRQAQREADAREKAKRPTHAWVFDGNYRVYAKDRRDGPVWREHWRKRELVGETSRSWIFGHAKRAYGGVTVPKNGKHDRRCIAFSEAEIDEQAWINDNGWRISQRVANERDPVKLRAIARIIGYVEPKGDGR